MPTFFAMKVCSLLLIGLVDLYCICLSENPLMEGDEEQSLSTDIERDLSEVSPLDIATVIAD